MPIRRILANDGVAEDRGKAAMQRGPVVYCVEAVDNGGRARSLQLPLAAELRSEFRRDLLNGVVIITGKTPVESGAPREQTLVAIPYYAWANRSKGEMAVWVPYQ